MLRLGVFSDIHWRAGEGGPASFHNPYDFDGAGARIAAAIEIFNAERADAVVVAGDLSHLGDLVSTAAVVDAIRASWGGPLLVVNGNHECMGPEDSLERAIGSNGTILDRSGITLGGVAVTGLPVAADRDGLFARGRDPLPQAGLTWPEGPLVAVSHYPLISHAELISAYGFPYPGDLIGREGWALPLVERAEPAVVLSGHVHARVSAAEGPLLQLTLGAMVEAPFECAVVDLDPDRDGALLRRRSFRLSDQTPAHDPVFASDEERWKFAGGWWRRLT